MSFHLFLSAFKQQIITRAEITVNRALARFFFAYSTGQLQQMLHHFRQVSVSLAYV
jgi:hypothetical protein